MNPEALTVAQLIKIGFCIYIGVMLARVGPAVVVAALEMFLEKLRSEQVKNVAKIRSLTRKIDALNLMLGEKKREGGL